MIVGEGVSTRSAGGKDRGRQGRGVGGVGRGRRAPERAGRGWPARGGGWQGLRRLAGPGRRRRSRRVRRRRRPGGGRAAPYAARRRPAPDRSPTADHGVRGGPGGDLPGDRRGRRGCGDRGADRAEPQRGESGDRRSWGSGALPGDPGRPGGRPRAVSPKARKVDADPVLRAQVIARLRAGHSPDQVAGRLRHEHSGQHAERVADTVSHEAIYTWIYALPKGELARQGILLRSGRTRRRPLGRSSSPGARIVGMTSIDARPAEASDRVVPGAWEGDLVIGKAGRSAMATLVERTSRYTVPVALPAGRRDALTTCDALIAAVSGMPSQLVKTLTWDQGSEMAGHAAFSLATAVDVYFAHPHSPWERGTNENTNGLLREYFPKGTDITDDQTYLDLVARELNNRPRRILGYRTPADVFTDLLASSIASTG